MFAYPKQAEFNRVISKTKIYAHARVSKRIKGLFVAQIDEILWKYKLSPETINLPASSGINEIQVFEISLKSPDVDIEVLEAMDKAIPFPLMFQLMYEEKIRFAASYKRPNAADGSKWVIEACFQTKPQPVNAERPPLPVALDLSNLYDQMVGRHIPLKPRNREGIAEQVARYNKLEAKKRAQQELKAQLAHEKQFNRKVELNAALRSLSKEIETLTRH